MNNTAIQGYSKTNFSSLADKTKALKKALDKTNKDKKNKNKIYC